MAGYQRPYFTVFYFSMYKVGTVVLVRSTIVTLDSFLPESYQLEHVGATVYLSVNGSGDDGSGGNADSTVVLSNVNFPLPSPPNLRYRRSVATSSGDNVRLAIRLPAAANIDDGDDDDNDDVEQSSKQDCTGKGYLQVGENRRRKRGGGNRTYSTEAPVILFVLFLSLLYCNHEHAHITPPSALKTHDGLLLSSRPFTTHNDTPPSLS